MPMNTEPTTAHAAPATTDPGGEREIACGWAWLPKRGSAINLARVSRVDLTDDHRDYAEIRFDHAECDDEDSPGFATTAMLPINGADTAAIRAALGLPAWVDPTKGGGAR